MCGSDCDNYLELRDDEDKKGNIILTVGRKGDLYLPFISIDKERAGVIIKLLKTKFKY